MLDHGDSLAWLGLKMCDFLAPCEGPVGCQGKILRRWELSV